MSGEIAAVIHRQRPVGITDQWELIVGGVCVEIGFTEDDRRIMEDQAREINAAVDAEVERRLDEITRRTN